MNPNLLAFLALIAWSEGTSTIEGSDDGYNVLVTGTPPADADVIDLGNGKHLFKNYDDHPNILVQVNPRLASTAAGRYQQMHHDWPVYKARLNLPDFGHESQDALAIQHIRECGALEFVLGGAIADAIPKCSNIWASFPGNTYGQRQRSLDALLDEYAQFGGALA